MYGLQTTIASDIPFLKTLYAVFIVYYLETKEVEITHLVRMFGSPKGVSDWANYFGRLLNLHIQSATNLDAVDKGDHFLHVVTGRQKDIYSQLSSQIMIL